MLNSTRRSRSPRFGCQHFERNKLVSWKQFKKAGTFGHNSWRGLQKKTN